jgi:hypothetical protein
MKDRIPRKTANMTLAVKERPKTVPPNRTALNYGRFTLLLLTRIDHSAPFQLCNNASHIAVESRLKIAVSADFIGHRHIDTPT